MRMSLFSCIIENNTLGQQTQWHNTKIRLRRDFARTDRFCVIPTDLRTEKKKKKGAFFFFLKKGVF